jgi:hypothetical protein
VSDLPRTVGPGSCTGNTRVPRPAQQRGTFEGRGHYEDAVHADEDRAKVEERRVRLVLDHLADRVTDRGSRRKQTPEGCMGVAR